MTKHTNIEKQRRQTFPENLNTLYDNRHLSQEEVHTILQSHAESSSLRGVRSNKRS
ncbi:MAG: hypothetical protein AAFW67_01205 [Cyanobacteria bacterium J06638_38]